MIFMGEWTDLQEGYQVGIGENKRDFSHFLALVFFCVGFCCSLCRWWRDLSSLSLEPPEESLISLDSLWIYAENDTAKPLAMSMFYFAYNFFSYCIF